MKNTWRFDIGDREPRYYHFRSFSVYNAFRWNRCERYGICTKHFYSNKEEYESWLNSPMKKNMDAAEEKKRMTLKRSDPIFTYHCTCGRCMGHMVPMSEKLIERRIKSFTEKGFTIIYE